MQNEKEFLKDCEKKRDWVLIMKVREYNNVKKNFKTFKRAKKVYDNYKDRAYDITLKPIMCDYLTFHYEEPPIYYTNAEERNKSIGIDTDKYFV
jgi:hypothetical protein